MSDLIQLTDAEVDLVSGGDISQSNAAEVVQVAENSGDAIAIARRGRATAVVATFNVSLLSQSNRISF